MARTQSADTRAGSHTRSGSSSKWRREARPTPGRLLMNGIERGSMSLGAVALLVLALPGLVHVDRFNQAQAQTKLTAKTSTPPDRAEAAAKAAATPAALPRQVVDMVEAILTAVRSGAIADLEDAVDWNEMKPDLGPTFVANPVAYWKALSRDGEGREILEILGKLLAGQPAVVPLGKDIENNRLYVWPAFADTPLSKLRPPEMEALAGLTTAQTLQTMREKDRYAGWRLVIGADGTWHSFRPD